MEAQIKSTNSRNLNKSLFSKVNGWYFEPRDFERKEDGKFYKKLGVKEFQRLYSATYGRVYSLLSGEDRWVSNSSRGELKYWDNFTRICEGTHFIGNLFFIPFVINSLVRGDYEGVASAAFVNTLMNVYPIMLQRYNRSRIYGILDKKEERESRKLKESGLEAA